MGADFIIATSWKPDQDDYLKELSIKKNGLGAQLFTKIFKAFFVHSIDVKSDYDRYYSVEYPNLKVYLDVRYGLQLNDEELEQEHIFLIDYLPQIVDTDYEDNVLDKVLECIKKLELNDES